MSLQSDIKRVKEFLRRLVSDLNNTTTRLEAVEANATDNSSVTSLESQIDAASAKSPLVDTDTFPLTEPTTLKKTLWSTIKSTLKTYFDTLYPAKANVLELNNTTAFTPDADYEPATKKYVDDNGGGIDINAQTEKTTPVDDDILLIEDSEDSYAKKKVKISNMPAGSGSYPFSIPLASTFNISADGASVTASLSDGIEGLSLSGSSAAGNNDRVSFRGKSVSQPFVLISRISFDTFTTYHRGGICLSDGTKYLIIGGDSASYVAAFQAIPVALFYSTISAFSSAPFVGTPRALVSTAFYIKVEDNGTNLIISFSTSGTNWIQYYSASRTALFPSGVSQIGIGLSFYGNTTSKSEVVCSHWSVT